MKTELAMLAQKIRKHLKQIRACMEVWVELNTFWFGKCENIDERAIWLPQWWYSKAPFRGESLWAECRPFTKSGNGALSKSGWTMSTLWSACRETEGFRMWCHELHWNSLQGGHTEQRIPWRGMRFSGPLQLMQEEDLSHKDQGWTGHMILLRLLACWMWPEIQAIKERSSWALIQCKILLKSIDPLDQLTWQSISRSPLMGFWGLKATAINIDTAAITARQRVRFLLRERRKDSGNPALELSAPHERSPRDLKPKGGGERGRKLGTSSVSVKGILSHPQVCRNPNNYTWGFYGPT